MKHTIRLHVGLLHHVLYACYFLLLSGNVNTMFYYHITLQAVAFLYMSPDANVNTPTAWNISILSFVKLCLSSSPWSYTSQSLCYTRELEVGCGIICCIGHGCYASVEKCDILSVEISYFIFF